MLRQVSLKNFKAFEQVTIDLGLITVLIGPDGTGKSSIAQALMLLKQSQGREELSLNGPYVALGDFEEIVHQGPREGARDGADEKEVAFRLQMEVGRPISSLIGSAGAKYVFEAAFDAAGEPRRFKRELRRQFTREMRVSGEEPLVLTVERDPTTGWSATQSPQPLRIGNSQCGLQPDRTIRLGFRPGSTTGPAESIALARSAIETLSSEVDILARSFLVPAIRGFDQPQYPLSKAPIDDFLLLGASAHPAEVASTLAYRRDLEDRISSWSEKVVGIKIRAKLIPPQNVTVEAIPVASPHVRRNLTNEGFGSNQLVPLLIQLATAPSRSVIAIEEPEIHLHPGAQSLLAETLVKVATQEKKQMLITTHSEHILMAFLTQVAQGILKPKDLSVYYFEKKEGVAQATSLSVNDKGQLSGGLRGFFEASLDQLEDYLKALTAAR